MFERIAKSGRPIYRVFCRSEAQPLAVPSMELREVKMLFCLSVNYTPKGLEAMGKNPKSRSGKFLSLKNWM